MIGLTDYTKNLTEKIRHLVFVATNIRLYSWLFLTFPLKVNRRPLASVFLVQLPAKKETRAEETTQLPWLPLRAHIMGMCHCYISLSLCYWSNQNLAASQVLVSKATLRVRGTLSLTFIDFRKQLILYIEKGPRSRHSTQADVHLDTTAFWRNRSGQLEEEKAVLEAKISRLQARVSELEERNSAIREIGEEEDGSARLQSLKRRRDGERGEQYSSRSAKQARTKIGVVASDERGPVLQDLHRDENGSEWDDFGVWHFSHKVICRLRMQEAASWTVSAFFREAQ